MQSLPNCRPNGGNASRLTYAVEIKPKGILPVKLIEGRIASDLKANLAAIRNFVEAAEKKKVKSTHIEIPVSGSSSGPSSGTNLATAVSVSVPLDSSKQRNSQIDVSKLVENSNQKQVVNTLIEGSTETKKIGRRRTFFTAISKFFVGDGIRRSRGGEEGEGGIVDGIVSGIIDEHLSITVSDTKNLKIDTKSDFSKFIDSKMSTSTSTSSSSSRVDGNDAMQLMAENNRLKERVAYLEAEMEKANSVLRKIEMLSKLD